MINIFIFSIIQTTRKLKLITCKAIYMYLFQNAPQIIKMVILAELSGLLHILGISIVKFGLVV